MQKPRQMGPNERNGYKCPRVSFQSISAAAAAIEVEAETVMKENHTLPAAIVVFLSYLLRLSSAMVNLRTPSVSFSVLDLPATFALPVNRSGICGALDVAHPLDACSSIRSGLPRVGNARRVRFVLIERGNCSFEDKVKHAKEAGFRAAIVYDNEENHNLMSMLGDGQGILQIHAVFVSKRGGEILKMYAQGEDGECCISPIIEGTAWTVLVISMFSLVIIISVLAILIFIRNHRLQRQRTSYSSTAIRSEAVNDLPCLIFHASCQNNNLTAETCAICLENYNDGETLRVLPCQHEELFAFAQTAMAIESLSLWPSVAHAHASIGRKFIGMNILPLMVV
ncbi:hypothetical protein ACLOJK_025675 [Asimina triloba]